MQAPGLKEGEQSQRVTVGSHKGWERALEPKKGDQSRRSKIEIGEVRSKLRGAMESGTTIQALSRRRSNPGAASLSSGKRRWVGWTWKLEVNQRRNKREEKKKK